MPSLTVIICTLNPNPVRFSKTLAGLAAQSLERSLWELIVVDNGSIPPVGPDDVKRVRPDAQLVREPSPGLAAARTRGVSIAGSPILVFVDDDNVLDPDYLETTLRTMDTNPGVGTAGGRIVPEYESSPPPWFDRVSPSLLALRDLGAREVVLGPNDDGLLSMLPFGAGMVARRAAIGGWFVGDKRFTGRIGTSLSSCEDTDMALCAVREGWETAYFPALRLTHLIPAGRLSVEYLSRLAYSSAKCYAELLAVHGVSTRPAISRGLVWLRKWRAYFRLRAWGDPARRIAWKSACGQFDGLTMRAPRQDPTVAR